MNSDRKTAIIVGILFVIATAASLIATALEGSVLNAPDYLSSALVNKNILIIGVLSELAAATSVVLIPAFFFPVLKRHNEGIALGYLGFRIIEALTQFVDVIASLLLITLSQEYVNAGSPSSSYFQVSGALLLGARSWAFYLDPVIFGTGALMFYFLLYRSRIVPRWLSLWGLIGAGLVLVAGLSGLFGNFLIFLALPIAVQEMAMAAWFIVKGFNPAATASGLEPRPAS
jgi:hypothetical protein